MTTPREFVWNCQRCGEKVVATYDDDAVTRWSEGMLIQRAMPDKTPTQREMLKMHWCETCVDEVYKQMEEY